MDKKNDSYETKYKELEDIIELLQSGDLSLDLAVEKYERSNELIKQLEEHLKVVENKITKIKAKME